MKHIRTRTYDHVAHKAVQRLFAYEIDASNPPDGRRIVRDEHMRLQARVQQGISTAADATEALRVLSIWREVA